MTTSMTAATVASGPTRDFGTLASDEEIERTARALERNGIRAIVVDNGDEAKRAVLELIPEGAEVFDSISQTLEAIGLSGEIQNSGRFDALKPRLHGMDRATQAREIRKLGASPDHVVGSVHAVTQDGQLIIASNSGSQLGPYASAGSIIFVVGAQKIVRDLEEGLRRIREHSFPLEDARARKAYGQGSGVNKLLIINRELQPRATVILVKQPLGF